VRPGEASVTARRVAAQRLQFEREPAPYGDPGPEDALARDVAGPMADAPLGPMARYLAARTLFFDRFVVRGLDSGVGQVVVLAAGYDGRAFRYAKPGTRWFEVDHPDTQADKRARIDRLGLDVDHVTFVAADFSVDAVDAALDAAGLDSSAPTLFLCEGLAVYLDLPVLEALLAGARRVAGPGSRLAMSVSVETPDAEGVERRRRFRERVAAVGEEARTVLEPGAAESLLMGVGWRPDARDAADRARLAGLISAAAA